MLFSLILLKSRSVFFAILIIGLLYIFKKNRKLFVSSLMVLSLSIPLLFFLKEDSANGRLFIWQTVLTSGVEDILFGFGKHGFSQNYMLWQAEYFNRHVESDYSQVADQVNNPFNEYLLCLVNYGIIIPGLIVFGLVKWLNKLDFIFDPSKVTVFFIMVFALFSYPFHYYFVIVILMVCLNTTNRRMSNHSLPLKKPKIVMVLSLPLVALFCIGNYSLMEMEWRRETDSLNFNEISYHRLEKKIGEISEFQHDFAYKLHHAGKFKQSNRQIEKYESRRTSYDVTLLKASNYLELKEYGLAIVNFNLAKKMIPSRFLPKYELYKIYSAVCENHQLKVKIAEEIAQTPLKVKTSYTISVKAEAKRFLSIHGK